MSDGNTLCVARVKYHNCISRFVYDGIDNLNIGDNCIIRTEEGLEFGNVVGFLILPDSERGLVFNFDNTQESLVSENTHQYQSSHDDASENAQQEDTHVDREEKKKITRSKNDARKIYKILRKSTDEEYQTHLANIEKENEAFSICKEKAIKHNLEIKLIDAHYYFDKTKLLFEFISENRVDFRELVKDLASHFHARIELRQIGVRDEAKILGGCSVCGRELCCKLMKSDFETITIKMAKEQNMPLNTAKISGQCGRLMCCIYYEYKTYCEIKKDLPGVGEKIVFNGQGAVIKDVNPLSRKLLIETADKRLLYIDMENIQKSENHLKAALSD